MNLDPNRIAEVDKTMGPSLPILLANVYLDFPWFGKAAMLSDLT
jgi:hypothetical protein